MQAASQYVTPNNYGLQEAKNGIERYQVLYNCHEDAAKKHIGVSYQGINAIDIEIPANAKSIPLSDYTDFAGVTLNVTNNSKVLFLFQMWFPTREIKANSLTGISRAVMTSLQDEDYVVILQDKTPWVAKRQGYDYGATRKDLIVFSKDHTLNNTVFAYNFQKSDIGVSYFVCSENKVFKNLKFVRTDKSKHKTFLLAVENQANVELSNIHIITPESNKNDDAAIQITNSAMVELNDITIEGTYSQKNKWGYGVKLDNIYDLRIDRMYARANWGVFGTNNINKATLRNCDINRFDIHCYGRDVRCYNCKFTDLYNQFSSVYGDVYFENCTFTNFIPMLIESSYNAYTPFDLTFKSCTFNLTASKNYLMTLSGLEAAHNSRPELSRKALPNITIKNCTVNLADDVKDWYIIHTGRVAYKEPLDYISKLELNRLKINGNADYKVFSTELKTTNPLKVVRKRVKLNKK